MTLPEGTGNQVPSGAGATSVRRVSRSVAAADENLALRRHLRPGAGRDDEPDDPRVLPVVCDQGRPDDADRRQRRAEQHRSSSSSTNSLIATDAFAGGNSLQSDRGWSNPTYDVTLADAGRRCATPATANRSRPESTTRKTSPYDCLAWAAIVFSTRVQDADGDGLPDKLEDVSGLHGSGRPGPAGPARDGRELEAQGSVRRARRDESGSRGRRTVRPARRYSADAAQVVDGAGHNHLPDAGGAEAGRRRVQERAGQQSRRIDGDPRPLRRRARRITPWTPAYASTDADEYLVPLDSGARRRVDRRRRRAFRAPTLTCQFPAFPARSAGRSASSCIATRRSPRDGAELTPAEEDACEAVESRRDRQLPAAIRLESQGLLSLRPVRARARHAEVDGPRVAGLPRPARQLRHRRSARRRRPRVAGLLGRLRRFGLRPGVDDDARARSQHGAEPRRRSRPSPTASRTI